jgi:cytochrome c oxidase subunit 2
MVPSYGDAQTVILAVFVGIALALAAVFVLVAARASRPVGFERVKEVGYALRRFWVVFLVALLSAAVITSLFLLPYRSSAAATADVRVTGGQFFWSIAPEVVPAGTVVRFAVTSADVNHGFGIYHPDGYLMGNVQAMPGYTNTLDLTLDDPGSYLISCLEYCGIGHHEMAREFQVEGP